MNLSALQEKLKNFINSIRIPSLLSFIINPSAKDPLNPTTEEALNSAPPASQNWVRLQLGKITSLGLPVWLLIAFALLAVAIYIASNSLQFFIEWISKGIALVPLAIIIWFIRKQFRK